MEFFAQAPGQHQICYVECPKLENENLITNSIALSIILIVHKIHSRLVCGFYHIP